MKIHISPFTYLFYALLLVVSHDQTIIATISAVVLHEAAHLIMIALNGCSVECIEVTPIGLTIHRTGITRHLQDFSIHIAGPLINLTVAALWSISDGIDTYPFAANFFFGLLNLLPIKALDGGKALFALLACFFNETNCRRIGQWVSNGALFLLWLLAASELLMLDGSPSLLFFCIGVFLDSVQIK